MPPREAFGRVFFDRRIRSAGLPRGLKHLPGGQVGCLGGFGQVRRDGGFGQGKSLENSGRAHVLRRIRAINNNWGFIVLEDSRAYTCSRFAPAMRVFSTLTERLRVQHDSVAGRRSILSPALYE
jgi:hypothetical protein